MVGRAANIITGVCHGLSLDVNREARCDTTTLLSVSPQEKPPTPNQLSRGNPKVPHSTPDSFPFTVVDVAGFLYGFFGVHSGPRGSGPTYIGAGLVTSMDEVLASIKGKIGVDLMLPWWSLAVFAEVGRGLGFERGREEAWESREGRWFGFLMMGLHILTRGLYRVVRWLHLSLNAAVLIWGMGFILWVPLAEPLIC